MPIKPFFIIILFCHNIFAQQDDVFKILIDSSKTLYQHKKHTDAIQLLSLTLNNQNITARQQYAIHQELYRHTYWTDKDYSISYLHESLKLQNVLTAREKATLNFSLSKIHGALNRYHDSVIFYSFKSLAYYEKFNTLFYAEKSNIYSNLSKSYSHLGNKDLYLKYVRKNFTNCKNGNYTKGLLNVYNNLGTYYSNLEHADSSLFYYRKAVNLNISDFKKGTVFQNIGGIYVHLKCNDSAEYYFNKALRCPNLSNDSRSSLYFNKAVIENNRKCLHKTLDYYYIADTLAKKSNNLELQFSIAEDLSKIYDSLNNYNKALKYHKEYTKLKDSLKELDIIKNTNELEKKYETEKKEKEILKVRERNKRHKITVFSLACLFVLFLVAAIAIYKSMKGKQLLAEREKELKEQRLQNVLKKQEITAINAMIEGQEKERKRIANDLHDDLGSLMASIKIHFNNLDHNNNPSLYKKVELLLDDAYQKIRQIAHSKNSGVIGKEGLLKSVKDMAIKMSSNNLEIEVTDFGLEERLENSLEITIFRIIQELLTNIVRHANAKHAEIQLIQHEALINIIVEDNGKGFNTKDIVITQNGMGISSIYERVEDLKGTMSIDSTLQKGTTVIIDIPI